MPEDWTDIINSVLDQQPQPVVMKTPANESLDKLGGGGGGGYSGGKPVEVISPYAHKFSTTGNTSVGYGERLPVGAPRYNKFDRRPENMNTVSGQIKEDPYIQAQIDKSWNDMVRQMRLKQFDVIEGGRE